MSPRTLFFALVMVSSGSLLRAQGTITGASDYALGGSSVMWIPNSGAIFLNPAEVSRVHQHEFIITGGRSFSLSSLTGNVFIPFVGTIAAGVGREPSETQYNLSYGRIFGRYHSAGVGFTYLEKNPDRSGVSLGLTLHFPSSSISLSGLHFGASVLNFAGDFDAEAFSAQAGAAFWVAPRILRLQVAYGRRARASAVSAGAELRLFSTFSLLVGTRKFSTFTGGIGFRHPYGSIEIAGGADGAVFTIKARIGDAATDQRDSYIRAGLGALENQSYYAARSYFLTAVEYDEYADEARRYSERSRDVARQSSSSAMNEARSLEERGALQDAIAIYKEIAASDPNNTLARQRLRAAERKLESAVFLEIQTGDSLKALQRYESAKVSYERALAMDPENADVRFRLDSLNVILKDDISATLGRADAHLARGRYSQAEQEYEVVLRRDPGNSRAREGLATLRRIENQRLFESGKAAYEEGQYEQALPIFETVLRQDTRHAEAKRYLELTRKALTPVVDAHFRAGLQQYLVEHYEEALEEWRKALRIDPENEAILGYAQRAEEKIKALEKLK